MTSADSPPERYHAMDSLRAAMMLGIIAIHACIPYGTMATSLWDFADRQPSRLADFVGFYLHTLTLPVFFVMAGFFAMMMVEKRGVREFLSNRSRRVLVPLIIGLVLCIPLIWSGLAFGKARWLGQPDPWRAALSSILPGSQNREGPLSHLWFLYFLVLYYLLSALMLKLAPTIPTSVSEAVRRLFRRVIASFWLRLFVFTLLTAVTLLFSPVLGASTSFLPDWRMFLGFGVFFYFGWFLYVERDLLSALQRGFWWLLALTPPLLLVRLIFLGKIMQMAGADGFSAIFSILQRDPVSYLILIGTASLLIWSMTLGFTGLFLKHFSRESAVGSYLSEASYWMYISHMPLVIWMQSFVMFMPISGSIKFILVTAVGILVTMLTYDLFVRSTFIGEALNGRRKPRALFARRARAQKAAQPASTL
jgi:glucan biosynthesis protein C